MAHTDFEISFFENGTFENYQSEIIGKSDEVSLFYSRIFNPDKSLKDRNTYVLLFFKS